MEPQLPNTQKQYTSRVLIGVVILLTSLIFLIAWWRAGVWYQDRLIAEQRAQAADELFLRASTLSAALNRRISLVEGLHAFVQSSTDRPGLAANFEKFAAIMYESTPGIRNLAIAPRGVIYYVYPVEGNIQVIGYDPLRDPRSEVREEVERAIETGQLVLSGPSELTQGGIGLIARKAIFKQGDYWGLVHMVMDVQPILERAGIGPQMDQYAFLLLDESGKPVYGMEEIQGLAPVKQQIQLQDGWWELMAVPKEGWLGMIYDDWLIFQGAGLTIGALLISVVYLALTRQQRLAQTVAERTLELQSDIAVRKKTEAALREREAQYRSVFESVSDGLFINDLNGFVVDFNPAAAHMHGYTEQEFSQLQPRDFIQPETYPVFEQYLDTVRRGEVFKGQALDYHRDGTPFYIEVIGVPFTYLGELHALAVVRDISEQVAAYQLLEKRVQERTRELSALLEVTRTVSSTLELRPLLKLILEQLKSVIDYSGAAIAALQGDNFVFLEYLGPSEREQVLRLSIPVDRPSLYKEVKVRRAPLIYSDLQDGNSDENLSWKWDSEAMRANLGYARSWLGVPLLVKDEFIGVLRVDHIQPDCFRAEDARLVLAFAHQAAVAMENARLYRQAQALAAAEERQRLARELHDSVSQALYGIALGARTARSLLGRDELEKEALFEPIDYVLDLAEAGLAEMRALIFELRPESLEQEGLVVALNKQAAALQARYKITAVTHLCDEPELPPEIKDTFYRVAQEAMQNTVKHAHASQVVIDLSCAQGQLLMKVCDNGKGFEPGAEFPGHLGLRSMRERVERIGGSLEVESAPGRGTCVQVRAAIGLDLF